jgi:hypothetical protein
MKYSVVVSCCTGSTPSRQGLRIIPQLLQAAAAVVALQWSTTAVTADSAVAIAVLRSCQLSWAAVWVHVAAPRHCVRW